jgi:hypothetical protein
MDPTSIAEVCIGFLAGFAFSSGVLLAWYRNKHRR